MYTKNEYFPFANLAINVRIFKALVPFFQLKLITNKFLTSILHAVLTVAGSVGSQQLPELHKTSVYWEHQE